MSTEDRALGALYGLAVGDALGMPTQFLSRAAVRDLYGTVDDFEPGPEINEISRGTPAGRVTDDTDQAVILAKALVDGDGTLDHRRFADDLLAWERRMVATGSADLLGPSTRRALTALADGAPLADAGRWGDTNGAAMRIAPVGIATPPQPLDRLCDRVHDASRLTHDTTIANAGASAVAAVVSAGVDGAGTVAALRLGVEAAALGAERGNYMAGADVSRRIAWAIDLVAGRPDEEALDLIYDLVGTGVATQEGVPAAFAIASLRPDDPWGACVLAASLGGDCDTVGAIAGAMVGACCGYDRLPAGAVRRVRETNDLHLEPLIDALLDLRSRP